MYRVLPFFIFILWQDLCFSQSIKGFQLPDSLNTKSYEQLDKLYNTVFRKDNNKAELYANSFLMKAKREKNDTKIADGYVLLHRLKNDKSALLYLDSMIVISKRIKNLDHLSDGYMHKGNYYFLKGEYAKSLNNYIAAKAYAKKDSETYHILGFNIGLLKVELEDYNEAIKQFLVYKQYLEENNQTKRVDYLSCLFALAYSYSKINDLNSSDYQIRVGMKKNQEINDMESSSALLLVSGINSYKRKNYKYALQTLENVSKSIEKNSFDIQNLSLSEYYIGKIFYNSNNKIFLKKFEKVDSIIIGTKTARPEQRDMYTILIDYYKKSKDKEKQLRYVEHLLTVDSLLNKNDHVLSVEMNKKYDTPLLLEEKEKLISDLNNRNYSLYWIVGLAGIGLLILFYLYAQNRKKVKLYQSRADILLHTSSNVIKSDPTNSSDNTTEEIQKKDKPKIILSDDKFKQLGIKLEEFEKNNNFLVKNTSLDILAKDLNTNRDYLSKFINEQKGKNFSQYLNELRIQYIVEELKINKNLQKYTIASIADMAGFNNSDSFTVAFKKITGTLPSYFIKALQETENN